MISDGIPQEVLDDGVDARLVMTPVDSDPDDDAVQTATDTMTASSAAAAAAAA